MNDNFPLVPATREELIETLERAIGVERFYNKPHGRRSERAIQQWNAEKHRGARS